MLSDLHIHSCFSDGTMTPVEIVSNAKENDISIISVCDHDILTAYSDDTNLVSLCEKNNIKLICGVELDCMFKGTAVHVLVYGFDINSKSFLEFVKKIRDSLDYMSELLIQKLSEDGFKVSPKEYSEYKFDNRNGGWKGINYLYDKKIVPSLSDGIKMYSKYGITYENAGFPDIKFVIAAAKAAGGYSVLAHPGERFMGDDEQLLLRFCELKKLGIDGIECYYPSHSHEFTKLCTDFCEKNKLLITGGSDSHGSFSKEVKGDHYSMGVVCPDVKKLNLGRLFRYCDESDQKKL